MKILFACSKEMNVEDLTKAKNNINFKEVKEISAYLKSISQEDSFHHFKTKEDIYDKHQLINKLSKPAIHLFSGISFRQIKDKDHPNLSNVYILSALYGLSKHDDFISYFRYDYSMKHGTKHRKSIYQQINKMIEPEDAIINLASKEFSKGIEHHNFIDTIFYLKKDHLLTQHSVASKKLRGQLINFLMDHSYHDLKEFSHDGYVYAEDLSTKHLIAYVKDGDL